MADPKEVPLADRLNSWQGTFPPNSPLAKDLAEGSFVLESQAARIATLEQFIRELSDALQPFAVRADYFDERNKNDDDACAVYIGQLRAARRALASAEQRG